MSQEAAELIGRIKVQGEQAYLSAMNRVGQATQTLAAKAKSAGSSILSGLMNPINLLIGAAGAGGLLGLVGNAMQASAEFDRFTRTIQTFSGSAASAQKTMSFLDKFSQNSVFQFHDLAEAGSLAAAFGFNIEKLIPLASKLGAAFGPARENLMEVVEMFGRLKGGEFGEVFGPRGLGRFGISRQDMARMGLTFDANGAFRGSIEQALNGVQRLIEQKFGNINKIMQASAAVKFSNAMDALGRATRRVGDALNAAFLPVIEKVTLYVNYLSDSGILTKVTEGFTHLFNGKGFGDWLTNAMAWVLAVFEKLPDIIKFAWNSLKSLFQWLDKVATSIINGIQAAAVALGNALKHGIESMMHGVISLMNQLNMMIDQAKAVLGMDPSSAPLMNDRISLGPDLETAPFGGIGDFLRQTGNSLVDAIGLRPFVDDLSKKHDSIMKGFTDSQKKKNGSPTGDPNGSWMMNGDDSILSAMNQIAGHTKRTAQAVEKQNDLKRYALGGGDLGAMGITPAEFYTRGGSATNRPEVEVNSGSRRLNGALKEIIGESLLQLQRQGVIQFTGRY